MATMIYLLKVARRLNISSKTAVSKQKTLNTATFQRLMHSQTPIPTNHRRAFAPVTKAQKNNHEVSEDHKLVNMFQHEIQYYGRLRKVDVDKLLEDVKESGVVSNLQGLFLLQCCSELISNKTTFARQVLAEHIWRTLKELSVQLDVSHYNALLNVYAETDHHYVPTDFLEEMVNAGILPNRVTFEKLIAQYCNEGQTTEASQILNCVKSEGIPVTEDMLSSLAYSHFVNNNDDAAFNVLKETEKLGISPTIKTYSNLLYVYANRGEIDNIRKTLKDCEDKGIWIPDKVLLRIIYNLSLYGFSQHVNEILKFTRRGSIYLREAIKIMYKLIEKHHYEVAFKIYQTLPENRMILGGNIFLQALITVDAPVEKTLEYCKLMEKEHLNPEAVLSAVQKSIANDMYESGTKLLEAWKQLGGVIKIEYFVPILKALGEAGQNEEFMNVVQNMISKFELQPNIFMLVNYILPYMQCDNDEILPVLLGYGIEHVCASNAVLIHLLRRNEIRQAEKFVRNFSMGYKIKIVKPSLLRAFKNTEDVPSFVSIVHHLYMLTLCIEKQADEDHDHDRTVTSREFIDSFIIETVDCILSKNESNASSTARNKYLIHAVFRNLIQKGISLSPTVVDDIQKKCKSEMTPLIQNALITLKSGNLIPKPIKRELNNMSLEKKLTNMEMLESLSKLLSEKDNKSALMYKKKLLHIYCNIYNFEKMSEVLEELHVNGVEISASTYATVIDAFLCMNKIEEAEFWLMQARALVPDFNMSKIIILKLATIIAEQGHFTRALECLKQPIFSSDTNTLSTCTKFLSTIMKMDDENYLMQAFDVLKESGYILTVSDNLLKPFIQLHLERGDNKSALEKFKWAHKVYGLAPCQSQLMKAFIEAGDEFSLRQVKDIGEKVGGSLNSYFNLAMAHLEKSQLAKAKQVINKYVPTLPETIVFERALYYYNNRQTDHLEKLFEILNDLNYDVQNLCIVLLKAFGHSNEWKKGYNLWIKMQQDNITPSNKFFDYFNLVINEKGNTKSILQEFMEAADRSDEVKTRELLEKLPLIYKSDGYSRLCKKSSLKANFADVIELCKDLRNRFNLDIHSFEAEPILNHMVKSKDVACIEKIGMYMSQELKNKINYNYYLNHAYLVSGSWNLYLKDIENRLKKGTLKWSNLNMHPMTALKSLFQHPELVEQYESIARTCDKINIPGVIQILWIYYFLSGNLKAETLWTQSIKHSRIAIWLQVKNFQHTTPEMYAKLAELLEECALDKSKKLKGFTSLIQRSLYTDHPNKYEIGLKCLVHGTRKLPMESYDIDLLVNLQKGLENSGIKWPWSDRSDNGDEKHKLNNVIKAIMKL